MGRASETRATLPDIWDSRLHSAKSADEIVCIVNEYVGQWSEADRARMPAECLPPRFGTAQDVSAYAFALTQARLDFSGPTSKAELLEKMCVFMSAAAMRIAQLAHWSRARIE